jgi:hypothetical protein
MRRVANGLPRHVHINRTPSSSRTSNWHVTNLSIDPAAYNTMHRTGLSDAAWSHRNWLLKKKGKGILTQKQSMELAGYLTRESEMMMSNKGRRTAFSSKRLLIKKPQLSNKAHMSEDTQRLWQRGVETKKPSGGLEIPGMRAGSVASATESFWRTFKALLGLPIYGSARFLKLLGLGRPLRTFYNWTRAEHFTRWLYGLPRQHFGPSAKLPNLFERRDLAYHQLENHALRWHFPPPEHSHNIFDVAARVNKVERIIGYNFTNRMLCIEALKLSGLKSPLYFEGNVYPIVQNKRIALLGDRLLTLVISEIWYGTGNSNRT